MVDAYGDHAVACRMDPGYEFRHDLVRDVVYDCMWQVCVAARKEAPVHFLSDPNSLKLSPADTLIYNWRLGKHLCLDVTGVSPLVLQNGVVLGRKVVSNVAKRKWDKYGGVC